MSQLKLQLQSTFDPKGFKDMQNALNGAQGNLKNLKAPSGFKDSAVQKMNAGLKTTNVEVGKLKQGLSGIGANIGINSGLLSNVADLAIGFIALSKAQELVGKGSKKMAAGLGGFKREFSSEWEKSTGMSGKQGIRSVMAQHTMNAKVRGEMTRNPNITPDNMFSKLTYRQKMLGLKAQLYGVPLKDQFEHISSSRRGKDSMLRGGFDVKDLSLKTRANMVLKKNYYGSGIGAGQGEAAMGALGTVAAIVAAAVFSFKGIYAAIDAGGGSFWTGLKTKLGDWGIGFADWVTGTNAMIENSRKTLDINLDQFAKTGVSVAGTRKAMDAYYDMLIFETDPQKRAQLQQHMADLKSGKMLENFYDVNFDAMRKTQKIMEEEAIGVRYAKQTEDGNQPIMDIEKIIEERQDKINSLMAAGKLFEVAPLQQGLETLKNIGTGYTKELQRIAGDVERYEDERKKHSDAVYGQYDIKQRFMANVKDKLKGMGETRIETNPNNYNIMSDSQRRIGAYNSAGGGGNMSNMISLTRRIVIASEAMARALSSGARPTTSGKSPLDVNRMPMFN